MKHEDILGPWKLTSMTATSRQGDVNYPLGESPCGMILYDASRYMSFTAMRPGRPRFASGDLASGTPEEIAAAFDGFEAYCGTYEVNLEKGVVTHHVETHRFPNWEGSDQVRFFQLSERRLAIDTAPILFDGTEWVIHVVFERPEGYSTVNCVGPAEG
jgi:hypothetical protein